MPDEMGREIVSKGRPQKAQIYVPTREAWLDSLASDITPSNVVTYLKSAEKGALSSEMQLFDRMIDRDARLASVVSTRRLAVSGLEFDIVPDDPDDARAVAAVDAVWEGLAEVSLEACSRCCSDAVPKGLSVAEIVWTPDALVSDIVEVPGKMLRYSDTDTYLQITVGGTKYLTVADEPNKFIVHSPRLKPGGKERRGLLRSLAMLWVAKHWAMRDWAAFSEIFGFPLRLGKYPSGSTGDDITALKDALAALGADSVAAIPADMEIDFPAPPFAQSNAAETPMQRIINYADTEYAIICLGQNLTTQGESGTGTLAASAHDKVRMDYRNADAKALAATIRRDLFRPIVLYRVGPDAPVPHLEFDLEESVDESRRAAVYVQLAQIPGMTFSLAQVREEFGIHKPKDEDDTLKPTPSPSAGQLALEFAMRDRGGKAFSAGKRKALSPGMRAAESIAENAAESVGFESVARLLDYVEMLAEKCQTPEQLLRRIQLAVPDLEDDLKSAGISMEEFTDTVARSMATSLLNGSTAVKNEMRIQK